MDWRPSRVKLKPHFDHVTRNMCKELGLKEFWDLEKFRLESGESVGEYCKYGFSYNSGTNSVFLSLDELKNLIET